jgi:hypothetical protein
MYPWRRVPSHHPSFQLPNMRHCWHPSDRKRRSRTSGTGVTFAYTFSRRAFVVRAPLLCSLFAALVLSVYQGLDLPIDPS